MPANYQPVTPEGKFFGEVYDILVPLAAAMGDLPLPLAGWGSKLMIKSFMLSKDNYLRAIDQAEPGSELRITIKKLMGAAWKYDEDRNLSH